MHNLFKWSGKEKKSTSVIQPIFDPTILDQPSMEELITNTFAQCKRKEDIIQALEHCTFLHKIPLNAPNVTIEQAQKDFHRERVLLNDVAFIPDKNDEDRSHAFALTLRLLIRRLIGSQNSSSPLPLPLLSKNTNSSGGEVRATSSPVGISTPPPQAPREVYDASKYASSEAITDLLLQRACRTSAGADSFFTVQRMLCIEGTFVTQKALIDDPPVHIDVFLARQVAGEDCNDTNDSSSVHSQSNNSTSSAKSALLQALGMHHEDRPACSTVGYALCSRVQVSNSFAVFDVSAMDALSGDADTDPLPWLDVDSVVVDESNFRTGQHWRHLHLIVSCPMTGAIYSSGEDAVSIQCALTPPPMVAMTMPSSSSQETINNSNTNNNRQSGGRWNVSSLFSSPSSSSTGGAGNSNASNANNTNTSGGGANKEGFFFRSNTSSPTKRQDKDREPSPSKL